MKGTRFSQEKIIGINMIDVVLKFFRLPFALEKFVAL